MKMQSHRTVLNNSQKGGKEFLSMERMVSRPLEKLITKSTFKLQRGSKPLTKGNLSTRVKESINQTESGDNSENFSIFRGLSTGPQPYQSISKSNKNLVPFPKRGIYKYSSEFSLQTI